ncbi:MAG: Txe/YoeB family addiction module toxin [Salinivirgaceae bacterium]|nr:Txe/YoeB family addiction module toxin [Salinivirgaceae bacterium]
MSYELIITNQAKEELSEFKHSGQTVVVKKIEKMLLELQEHPKTGTGKPEQLKYDLSGYWSRRITQEHRMIYKIFETEIVVEVVSYKGHYE